jgi:Tfp pilus assembly protein PilO
MAMPPMDEKGKNAIAVAVVLLIGAVGYWKYMYAPDETGPLPTTISSINGHADSLEATNAKMKREVAAGAEAKIRADAERYTTELAGLRRLVPTAHEVPALLDQVSNDARQVGLDISQFIPDGVLNGDDFDMARYSFTVIGPYHKIAEFLTTVASSPRIITPVNVVIAPSGGTETRKPRSNETFVSVKFGLITYVAKTKPIR